MKKGTEDKGFRTQSKESSDHVRCLPRPREVRATAEHGYRIKSGEKENDKDNGNKAGMGTTMARSVGTS
jgi:hypothetical protein